MIRNIFRRLVSWNGFLATFFTCVLAYATISVPHFASAFNLSQAAAGVSEKAILLLPMALLIIAREIDLSVASILALTSVVLGVLIRAHVALVAAIPLVLATGITAGALNGLLVTGLNLPSLVVTLGTMALFRGIGYIMLGTRSVNELPDALTNFGINEVGPTAIPWTIVPFVILAPLFAMILHRTALGRANLRDRWESQCRALFRGQGPVVTLRSICRFRTDVCAGRYCVHGTAVKRAG
jgi:rhamnose transport system permease protein